MLKRQAVVLLVLVIFHIQIQNVKPKLLVHTKMGGVQGVPADDGDYVMFLGIPYAIVNTSNPFGASKPHPIFEKTFKANDDTVNCPQFSEDGIFVGVVNCLQINFYVPNTNNDKKSVFVYIHGGSNAVGHKGKSLYGPKYLVRHDIIVVTLNYRLGTYGFLCTDHSEIPGNQGLKDQYNAIKWIKDNIQAFGGDPQKITLGGHSSGSMCVDAHLVTKQSRLFEQAIIQSGSARYPRFIQAPNTIKLLNISDRLGYQANDVNKAINFLSKSDPKVVLETCNNSVWRACIENKFENVFTFIDEHPEVSEAKNVNGMNILGGFTDRECIICNNEGPSYNDVLSNPNVVQYDLSFKFDLEDAAADVKIVEDFYSVDNVIEKMSVSPTDPYTEFLSDYDIVYPMQRTLVKYSEYKNTKVYQYMFRYNGFRNLCKKMFLLTTVPGAAHCDELGYLFTNLKVNPENPNEEDEITINRMTTLWSNFMKYGDPTPYTTELIPVTWPPLTAGTVTSLQIYRNLSVISRPFRKNMAFWDLFFEANKDKLIVGFAEKSSAKNLLLNHFNILILITILSSRYMNVNLCN